MSGGKKTWNTNDVLTSADMDNFVAWQVISQVTSSTHPGSPPQGAPIIETDTSRFKLADAGGNWRIYGPPAGIYSQKQRTGGSLTINNTGWTDLSNSDFDTTIPAVAGDLIAVTFDYVCGAGASTSVYINFVCTASGNGFAPTASTSGGIQALADPANATALGLGQTAYRSLVSGDISGGNVVIRVRYRESSATNSTVFATADFPVTLTVRNLGPNT